MFSITKVSSISDMTFTDQKVIDMIRKVGYTVYWKFNRIFEDTGVSIEFFTGDQFDNIFQIQIANDAVMSYNQVVSIIRKEIRNRLTTRQEPVQCELDFGEDSQR